MCSWSIVCMMAASLRNSIGLFCIWSLLRHLMATWILSPSSLFHTPCWTTPNSPTPSSLLMTMLSAGMMCLLGTFTWELRSPLASSSSTDDWSASSFALGRIICLILRR
uniref:Uncharacterized protein n=1 Tax=Ixodes ricinus TaxID=34613 RepID=A0A6B0UA93_IXORI